MGMLLSKYLTLSHQDRVTELRMLTGASIYECIKAVEYGGDDGLLAVAYLKAKSFAVSTPNMSFEDRVQMFYRGMAPRKPNRFTAL